MAKDSQRQPWSVFSFQNAHSLSRSFGCPEPVLVRYGTKLVRYQCPREVEGRAHLHRYNRPRADEDRHIGMRVALIQYSRPYVRPLTMLQQQSGTSSRERPDRLHMRKKQATQFFLPLVQMNAQRSDELCPVVCDGWVYCCSSVHYLLAK
jgi:hypothetical protein